MTALVTLLRAAAHFDYSEHSQVPAGSNHKRNGKGEVPDQGGCGRKITRIVSADMCRLFFALVFLKQAAADLLDPGFAK